MAKKKEVGRPCELTDEIIEKSNAYILNYEDLGDVVPNIAGLACELKKARSTIYKWVEDKIDQRFSDIVEQILSGQERKCINKGLKGEFNSSITKLLLCKHGYTDKPEPQIDQDAPPVDIHFHVKEAVSEIKTTNAKP